jgi:hypothetical protein
MCEHGQSCPLNGLVMYPQHMHGHTVARRKLPPSSFPSQAISVKGESVTLGSDGSRIWGKAFLRE